MFKENFVRICLERGISPSKVLESIGLNRSIYSGWNDESVPRKTTLIKLANYFNISVEDLLKDDSFQFSEESKNDGMLSEPLHPSLQVTKDYNFVVLPIYSSIKAGFQSNQNKILEHKPVYLHQSISEDDFVCFQFRGDEMYPKIEDGDYVEVQKAKMVENNSFAVVLIDESEGTISQIEYKNNGIILQPYNHSFPPRKFYGEELKRIKILGQVKKVVKIL